MIKLNLRLFDGDGAGAAPAGDGATTGANPSAVTPGGKTSGAYDNVVFGKQPETKEDAAGPQNTDTIVSSSTLDDKNKAFDDLIRGEYKDQYTARTQDLINRRFKETKNLQSQVDSMSSIIQMVSQKYGVDASDYKKLQSAIESDNDYWEELADEAGMSVDQYKQFTKLQRENEVLKAKANQDAEYARQQERAKNWYNQFEALKQKFPNIDPSAELEDPDFVRMLQGGVPVEQAYKVRHMDDIVSGVIQTASAKAEKRVADNIRAKGNRPSEVGASSRSPFTVKDDVSKLSKADRAEIARRVSRGETITF